MLRRIQQVLGAALLDDRAFFHHHDAAGITRHHGQVVADEENGSAFRPRQLDHQFHDIALDDRIKRRRRFIGDQQSGFQQHDRGQHDALAHAAGKLVRIGRQRTFGVADAHPSQHVENFLATLFGRQLRVKDQPLLQLPANRHRWVEGGHRLLKHHADLRAAETPKLLHRQGHDILPLVDDRPAGDGDGRRQKRDERAGCERLSRAAFADDAEDFARGNIE
ncbi:hypothetical protein D3C78_767370 [compost metagenome]